MKFSKILILITALTVSVHVNAADSDGDGIDDTEDNCQLISNPGQEDTDRDFFGNACDADLNNDGIVNTLDLGQYRKIFGSSDQDYDFNVHADLNSDGIINTLDVGKLRILFGKSPGPRGLTPAELDPPTLVVDTSIQPSVATIPAVIAGNAPRPLTRLTSSNDHGYSVDIVEQEVILITSDPQEKDDFVSRWNGVVLSSLDTSSLGNTSNPTFVYVINVNPSTVDSSQLNQQLVAIDQHAHGSYKISSTNGLKLLALVAQERLNNGLNLSLNMLLKSADYEHRSTNESNSGVLGTILLPPPSIPFPYQDNAYLWPYLNYNPDPDFFDQVYPLDTGVAEAWRLIEPTGKLVPSVNVAIFDGGFIPNTDFPPYEMIGETHIPNPDPTGCGNGSPALPGTPCYWHGTYVTLAGFALPNNGFGSAGPGGPVTNLILAQSPVVDERAILDFIEKNIPAALDQRPRIINLSFSLEVPEWLCTIACGPLEFIMNDVL